MSTGCSKAVKYLYLISLSLWMIVTILNTSMFIVGELTLILRVLRYSCVAILLISECVYARMWGQYLMFSIGFVLLAIAMGVVSLRMARYMIVPVLILAEILNGNRSKRARVWLITSILLAVCSANAELPTYMDLALFAWCAPQAGFERIAKTALVITTVVTILVVVSAWIGVIPWMEMGIERKRFYLGFKYPLFPAQYGFLCTCLVAWLRNGRLRLSGICMLSLMNYALYHMTDSRLSFGLSMVVICFCFLSEKYAFRITSGVLGRSLSLSFIICALISVCAAFLYDAQVPWQEKINVTLGDRIALAHDGLSTMGIPALGQKVKLVGNGLNEKGLQVTGDYNYIDSGYVQLLVIGGPVLLLLFVGSLTKVSSRALESRDITLLFVLAVTAVHLVLDDLSLALQYDTFLLTIGCVGVAGAIPIAGASKRRLRSFSKQRVCVWDMANLHKRRMRIYSGKTEQYAQHKA